MILIVISYFFILNNDGFFYFKKSEKFKNSETMFLYTKKLILIAITVLDYLILFIFINSRTYKYREYKKILKRVSKQTKIKSNILNRTRYINYILYRYYT